MTLVAAYSHKSFGTALVGDLLTSSEGADLTEQLPIPARFDGSRPPEANRITGVAQKLNLVSPSFATGWCGNLMVARSVLRGLQSDLPQPANTDEVFAYIDNFGLSKSELEDFSLVFSLLKIQPGGSRVEQTAMHNGELLEASPELNIRFKGTGSYHFFDSISVLKFGSSVGGLSIWDYLGDIITRGATSFFSEVNNWANYDFKYGGSFEYITPSPIGWIKLPYSVVFWALENGRYTPVNPVTIHSYRPNGTLVIDQLLPASSGTQHRRFAIDPIFGKATGSNGFLNIPLSLGFSVHYLIDRSQGSNAEIRMQIIWGSEQPFEISIGDEEISMQIHPDRLDRMIELSRKSEPKR